MSKMAAKSFVFILSTIFLDNYVRAIRLELLSIQDCDLPPAAYAPAADLVPHTWTVGSRRGRSFVIANFTVPGVTDTVSFDIKGYHGTNSKKVADVAIQDITCRHPIAEVILKKLRVKYIRKDCIGLPGKYSVPELSIDDLIRKYDVPDVVGFGIYILEVNFHTKKGTIICLCLKTDIKRS